MNKSVDIWDSIVNEGINSYDSQLKPRTSTVVVVGSSKSVQQILEVVESVNSRYD